MIQQTNKQNLKYKVVKWFPFSLPSDAKCSSTPLPPSLTFTNIFLLILTIYYSIGVFSPTFRKILSSFSSFSLSHTACSITTRCAYSSLYFPPSRVFHPATHIIPHSVSYFAISAAKQQDSPLLLHSVMAQGVRSTSKLILHKYGISAPDIS